MLDAAQLRRSRSPGDVEGAGDWGHPETPRQLVISGRHMEYRGANPDDWGNGTFTLREDTQPKQLLVALTECGLPNILAKLLHDLQNRGRRAHRRGK